MVVRPSANSSMWVLPSTTPWASSSLVTTGELLVGRMPATNTQMIDDVWHICPMSHGNVDSCLIDIRLTSNGGPSKDIYRLLMYA